MDMPVITNVIQEDRMTLTFPVGAQASKYDDWSHYRNQFNSAFGGTKAVDCVYAAPDTAWLIELKDYRVHPRTKAIDLPLEVAIKVRDTMAGLVSAGINANDAEERQLARLLLQKPRMRVVLHLEVPAKQSRLRRSPIDLIVVQQKLKQLIRSIDPHPVVVDQHSLKPDMDWGVAG